MMIFLSMMIYLILIMLTLMLNLISKKTYYDREKNSPFECGFDPKNLARLPFSLQFFLIAIIFVIFDVELTLLLPTIMITKMSNSMTMSISLSLFIMILIFGVIHEHSQGSLNWAK
uniref:NADH-ubiquinone oxidoreductase chain 3 n=1 Tax=Curculionoidea sp. 27 KM-2017 TaxID=2219411 RepID=A0A346RKP4_9CUCU|nr:NADH dehydrogenase subunit 3 [Curculionoidea sp. 27 KM-2017]